MKKFSLIALLVVSVIYVALTACTLKASTPPAVSPTPSGEAPFPFQTGSVATFGTQTAIALTPVGTTPQVTVTTTTPAPGQPQVAATETPQSQAQPTATTGAAINTPVVNRPTTYVLQKGEFPYCIARRFDLDLPSFLAANGLSASSNNLSAGTSLKIPATGNWNTSSFGSRALRAHPASYAVVAGDTLYSIACKYGDVTPEAILAVNRLSSASDIKAGTTLQIP